jgi:hypothetical protein
MGADLMTAPNWPALIAEVYGFGDSRRGQGPRRFSAPRPILVLAVLEAVDWRARLATFRADLAAQRRSA